MAGELADVNTAQLKGRTGTNTEAATDPSLGSGTLFSKLRGIGADLDTIADYVDTLETEVGNVKGYVDTLEAQLGATGDAAGTGTSGTAHGKLRKLIELLEDSTNGLAVIRAYVDTLETQLGATGDAAGTATTGTGHGKLRKLIELLEDSTNGLAALKAYVDTLETRLGTGGDDITTRLATIAGYLDAEVSTILAARPPIGTTVYSALATCTSASSAGSYGAWATLCTIDVESAITHVESIPGNGVGVHRFQLGYDSGTVIGTINIEERGTTELSVPINGRGMVVPAGKVLQVRLARMLDAAQAVRDIRVSAQALA